MARSATFLLFLIFFTCLPLGRAQTDDLKQTDQAEYKIGQLKFQIQRVTDGLIKDGQSLTSLERALLWAHLGNLTWNDDRDYSRRMLVKAVDEIESASKQKRSASEPQSGKEQLVSTVQIILRTLNVRDKKLSERLLEVLSHLGDDKQTDPTNQSNTVAEALVDAALLVLNSNVKRAAGLASQSLRYGEANKLPFFITTLRKQNPELADALFAEALDLAQSRQSNNLLLGLTFAAFPTNFVPTKDEALPDELRRALLKALWQGVIQESQASTGYCVNATGVARLLGEFDRLLPQEAVAVRAAVWRCQLKSPMVEEALSTTPPKTVEDFLDLASKTKNIETRVFTLVRASQFALQQGDFKRAIKIIDNMTTDERGVLGETWEGMRRDMATDAALSYYAKKDLVTLEEIISATPAELRPFVNLSVAEGLLNDKKSDQTFVREKLVTVRQGLARREPSFLLYYPYMKLVGLYARVDLPEAFQVLREAVKVINRASQPDKSQSKLTAEGRRTEETIAGDSLEPLALPEGLVDANSGEIIDVIALLESPSLRARARLSVLGSLVEQKLKQISAKPTMKNGGNK